jgi:hypothetical protein
MIIRSQVGLWISCEADDIPVITARLGTEPSEIIKSESKLRQPDGTMADKIGHSWVVHSPMSAESGDPTARLWTLVEVIRPFAERLVALDTTWYRWINIVYWVTPLRPTSVYGEFDWFRMPASLMKILAEWNLNLSYEVFWQDHPDRKKSWRLWKRT